MGAYCELYINKYPIALTKNEIDPYLLSVFQKDDIKIFQRKINERYKILYANIDEENDNEKAIQFVNNAKIIKDRLNVMGFTFSRVKEMFEISKADEIKRLKEYLDEKTIEENEDFYEKIKSEINLLDKSDIDDFLIAFKEIIQHDYGFSVDKSMLSNSTSPLIFYLLEYGYGFERFPTNYDLRTLLRAFLEFVNDDEIITYDITEVVDVYYNTIDEKQIYDEIVNIYTYEFEIGDKFIILTEGTTDIYMLENSLKLLYPHLVEFYSFMDFGNSNASGSASSLVTSIKSFIGAGFKNKIIAIFDNDTAAEEAKRGLAKTKIPDNIKILNYPNLKFAENYPTIGPTGESTFNVNGLAGSIEIYLGEETLTKNGKFIPVHWKGYNQSLNKYQGEILEKEEIQNKFKIKIEKCRENAKLINEYDWSGIKEIFKVIFNAFN